MSEILNDNINDIIIKKETRGRKPIYDNTIIINEDGTKSYKYNIVPDKEYFKTYYLEKLKDVKTQCPNCMCPIIVSHKARHMQSAKCKKAALALM